MPRAGPAMQQQGRARSRARDTPPHSADNRRISLAGRMCRHGCSFPRLRGEVRDRAYPRQDDVSLAQLHVQCSARRPTRRSFGKYRNGIQLLFWYSEKDATDALHHHRQGSAFSSARTSRTEFAAARSLKSSNELWPGSPPARSDKLRTATKGILFA